MFRQADMNTHLIAKKQEIPGTFTIVDLQGNVGREFVVSFQFTEKPRRAKFAEGWPSSKEENLERLKNSGLPVESGVPKCRNCDRKLSFLCTRLTMFVNCLQSSATSPRAVLRRRWRRPSW